MQGPGKGGGVGRLERKEGGEKTAGKEGEEG